MKCPQCNDKELIGKQKYCSGACKMKASRSKNVTVGEIYKTPVKSAPSVTSEQESVTPNVTDVTVNETYSDYLKRRGGVTRTIRVGYPKLYEIDVPLDYTDEDLDRAIQEVINRLGYDPRQKQVKFTPVKQVIK